MWTDEPAREGWETLLTLAFSTLVGTEVSPDEKPPVRWEALAATAGNAGAEALEAYGAGPSGQTCEALAA